MTKAKHTPGPWSVDFDHPTVRTIAYIRADKMPSFLEIAPVYQCNGADEQTANAYLIAAAPDLLEAAKECLKCEINRRNDLRHESPAAKFCDKRIAKIEAAIAKAEGNHA